MSWGPAPSLSEGRRSVQDLKKKVSLLQEVVKKRRKKQDVKTDLAALLSAPPPSDDVSLLDSEDGVAYQPTYSMMNRDQFSYTKHYPSTKKESPSAAPVPAPAPAFVTAKTTTSTSPPHLRLTTRSSPKRDQHTSIRDLLDLDTAPHETLPQDEEDEEEVRRLLFARTVESPSSSASPAGVWESDPIVVLPEEVGMVTEGTQVRTKNLGGCSDAVTQVNSEACSCGRSHHSSPCRSRQGSPVRVIGDYCVHATTTTKVDTPRYALPTWSSWPVASRFSPVEIDPASKISKSPRRTGRSPSPLRRRPSPSPMRRPSPSPIKRGRLLVRSPSYEASSRLYEHGMVQKAKKDLITAAAQKVKTQTEQDEADRYRYQPNVYRSESGGRRGHSTDPHTFTRLYDESKKKARSPAPAPRSSSKKPDWKVGPSREASPFERQFRNERKMKTAKKKKRKSPSPRPSRPPVPQRDVEREKERGREREQERERGREREREKERERERGKERERERTEDLRIEKLFNLVDQDGDGYWSFEEALVWGAVTGRGEMTKRDWFELCERLGADSRVGLPLKAVKRSYVTTGAATDHLVAMQRYVPPMRSNSVPTSVTSLDYEEDLNNTARTSLSRLD